MVDGNTKDYLEKLVETPFAKRIDNTTTANAIYIGKAVVGSDEGANIWQIKKIDTSSNTSILWAGGNAKYDNVWTNRASLSYS